MINSKHMATFLLGAAVGAAMMKYNTLSQEEKDELLNKIKDEAGKAKDTAVNFADQMQEYFQDLQKKGMDTMKGYMTDAEKIVNDVINQQKEKTA